MARITTRQVELAAMVHFNHRKHLIVPNISWGLGIHECDLLVVRRPSNHAVEVEIKISKADLVKDKEKRHGHKDRENRIRELWFAMPVALEPHIEHVPDRAGILLIEPAQLFVRYDYKAGMAVHRDGFKAKVVRKAEINTTSKKLTDTEVDKVLHLGCMRIHSSYKKLESREATIRDLKKQVKILEKANK